MAQKATLTIKDDSIILTFPRNKGKKKTDLPLSSSGKSHVLATSSGFQVVGEFNGEAVSVGLNVIIKK